MKRLAGLALIVLLTAAPTHPPGHDDHAGHSVSGGPTSDSTKAYEAANATMHKEMAISYSGNPDVDFVRGMIPHHRGAIDMAKAVIDYGTDPEIRKLAEDIINAQEKEIAWMHDWLAKNKK